MFHVDTVANIQAIRQHVFSLERDTMYMVIGASIDITYVTWSYFENPRWKEFYM